MAAIGAYSGWSARALDSCDPRWPQLAVTANGGAGIDLIVDQLPGPLAEVRDITARVLADLGPFLRSGALSLPIDRVFGFDELGEAFARMRANQHFGKIIVAMHPWAISARPRGAAFDGELAHILTPGGTAAHSNNGDLPLTQGPET